MDKAAIDETDDFGVAQIVQTGDIRDKFSTPVLVICLALTFVLIGVMVSLLQFSKSDSLINVDGMALTQAGYQQIALGVTMIWQLVMAFTGVVAIVYADRRAWSKYDPGTKGRLVFEAVKWTLVTLALLTDAYFLEHAYEVVFI
jgi:hypothetical protein